jgi:hypothetical protein
MRVGAYTLDLYCDNNHVNSTGIDDGKHEWGKEFPCQIVDELGSSCRKQARARGWLLGKEKTLCPKCSGKKPRGKK